MELFQRKVLLQAVLCTTTLLNTLQLSCCTTSCSSIGSPGCICTCTSTTSSLSTSTTSSTTSTSTSPSSETSSSTSSTSSTTSSTREASTTSSVTSSSTATSTSSSTSASSTIFTTSSTRTTTTSSTISSSSQSPSTGNDQGTEPTQSDQGSSEIDSRTPQPTITTQSTQDNEANNITDNDSSSPPTGRNSEQDENDNGDGGSSSNNNDNNADEYDQSVPTLSSDTTTQVSENNWNETDALNGTAILIIERSTKKVISIILPLICCIIFGIILIIFLAKKYKKKTKFKNHIESQVTYELEDDFDNTKTGDLGQGFSHGDTIAVVAENLNSDNRRKSEQEMVLYNTSLTLDQVLRLEGSVAQAFSGNGKGLSKVRNNKLISGNGSGTNFPPEHAQMNESEKALSCGEKKKKLISGNGSGANFPQEHALLKGPRLPEMEERRAVKDPKPMAWDESKKSSDQIVSEKEVKHHEKHTTLLDDIPDNEEIPIVADEQDDVEEIITKTKQSSDSKETERKFVEKERKERNSRQSNKKPNTHLSAADVEELEKLKNREKNSTKMLKKLKSVLNLVITEEDIIEDEDTKRVGDNVDGSKPHLVTKVDLKKSQMEIDSFLDTLYLDEKEDSQEDIKANDSTSKLDTENEDTEESLCSWDSDTELEKEIADLFLKEEKINQTSRERKSPDGAEMEIPIDNSLCKAYIMWLIWCKERCTCGAFLENPFGKNSGAIEKELIRNAEEYVKDNFPYLKDKMSLKSFENKNSKRDPSEKT